MITGAIVGALGALGSKGLALAENYQQAKIEERRLDREIELARLNAGKETQVASYKHDTEGGTASLWVINILRLVRPALTVYLLFLVSMIWYSTGDRSIIALGVLDLATMAVAWWFGSRDLGRKI